MPRYFLGADVGGTKSHVLIADQSGRAIGFGASGSGNPEGVGYDGMAQVLLEAMDEALSDAGITRNEIVGAGFGIGGYDWPSSQREPTLQALQLLGLNAPLKVVNDAIIGLLAGAADGWGVAVVAGTSCNCWGRDQSGREGRMTGFSFLGEAAGAGELVSKALQAVALEWTWRGPPTRLTQAFVELAGVQSVEELLEGLTIGGVHIGASAAPLVFQVAAEGDQVAHELILWAGRELADMAIGVIRQLGFESLSFEVVLAGSFFNGSPLLAETIRETIHPVAPGVRLVRMYVPPVAGAVVLGMEQRGINPSPLRSALIQSTEELLQVREQP
ncbi:MAG: BadF/BadG/BcrA/BcrD ATPase family protein [Anaerolineae bacterium]